MSVIFVCFLSHFSASEQWSLLSCYWSVFPWTPPGGLSVAGSLLTSFPSVSRVQSKILARKRDNDTAQ